MGDEFNEKEIKELMEKLSKKRPVFDSEDDFKFSLAWEIKEKYRDHVEIRLEKKMNNNKNASSLEEEDQNNKNERIDIFIIVKNENYMEKIGIELKYFTAKLVWPYEKNDEKIILKNQAAENLRRYDAWHDVERLENFIRNRNINKGFAIWLTNIESVTNCDKIEKKIKKDINKKPNYYNFRICDERQVGPNEILDWKEDTSDGMKKGREDSINISGYYKVHWEEYNKSNYKKEIPNSLFKYSILEIKNIQNNGYFVKNK